MRIRGVFFSQLGKYILLTGKKTGLQNKKFSAKVKAFGFCIIFR